MTYDGLVLAAAAAEIKEIVGGRIEKIRQHNATDLTFLIHTRAGEFRLFMSVDPQFPRVYLTSVNTPVPQSPPNFCMLLRKYIQGAFVSSVEQVDFDRILRVRTEAPDGNRNTLVIELMGKHSNMMLLSDDGKILGAAKNISAAVSRYRQVFPGRDYMPPPGKEKESPLSITRERFDELWESSLPENPQPEEIRGWLVGSMNGIGPVLGEEIVLRADGASRDEIWDALQSVMEHVRKREYLPVLVTDERGRSQMVYPVPLLSVSPKQQHERYSVNEALDAYFRTRVSESKLETARTELLTSVTRSIASRKQSLIALKQAISDGDKAEKYKNLGDLVLANLSLIQKGDEKATIIDYYDPGMPEITIDLDPLMTPKENADRLYRRYRKVRDAAEAAKMRTAGVENELRTLQNAKEQIETISEVERLKELRQSLEGRGVLRREVVHVPGKRIEPEFGGARIRRTTSSDGWEILYGENSESNDYLTTKVARPSDMWLHARSITGAHVVIRTNKRPDAVPRSTIIEAARIAAQNSDAKHSSLVPVDYTLRKYVRKPRGGAPGFVRYQNEKTLDISPKG